MNADVQPIERSRSGLATLAGTSAVLMWSVLALFTDLSGSVPPFQLAAMTFAIGAVVGLVWQLASRRPLRSGAAPGVVLIGSVGLFAYHALYFTALRHAPAIDASLIAYLWPLLIVVGSALLPGQQLGWHHVAGAIAGFAGTALIVTRGSGWQFNPEFGFGYGVALAAAFTWASYSLVARRFAAVPSSVVTVYCAMSAVLALCAHLLVEEPVWPQHVSQWLAIGGLGLLPVGASFFLWDHGMKHGNVPVIGASSYAAPLLSSIILVLAGRAEATWLISVACLLITGGAALAAKNIVFRRPR